MPVHASCCGEWITISEEGVGFARNFDCRAFMSDQSPETESQRRAICQALFDRDRLCPEIAPYCEQFKDDLQRERSRARDEAERRAEGTWPPSSRGEDDIWDAIHSALDAAGLIPGFGIAPDAINAGIYSIEGDWFNAGISAVGMVEGIGQGATASRLGVKLSKKAAGKLGKQGLTKAFKDAKALDKALNDYVRKTPNIKTVRRAAAKMNNARSGSLFERWVNHYVFHEPVGTAPKRLRVPLDLNEALDLDSTRISDFYIDADGTVWDSKIYLSAGEVSYDQVADYERMLEQGWVWTAVGERTPVTGLGYIFATREAALANRSLVHVAGGAEVYYIDDLGQLVLLN